MTRLVRSPRPALALAMAMSLVAQGCSFLSPTEHSRILTAPNGMRVFTRVTEIGGTPMLCPAFGLSDPVHGVLAGALGEREPMWLVKADGTRLSVVWPEGFVARFEPEPALYSDEGDRIARAGEDVELSQTTWGDATGTFEDPYLASGLVFNGCYPYVK